MDSETPHLYSTQQYSSNFSVWTQEKLLLSCLQLQIRTWLSLLLGMLPPNLITLRSGLPQTIWYFFIKNLGFGSLNSQDLLSLILLKCLLSCFMNKIVRLKISILNDQRQECRSIHTWLCITEHPIRYTISCSEIFATASMLFIQKRLL